MKRYYGRRSIMEHHERQTLKWTFCCLKVTAATAALRYLSVSSLIWCQSFDKPNFRSHVLQKTHVVFVFDCIGLSFSDFCNQVRICNINSTKVKYIYLFIQCFSYFFLNLTFFIYFCILWKKKRKLWLENFFLFLAYWNALVFGV